MSSAAQHSPFAEVGSVEHVATQRDVAAVVERMLADLVAHPAAWENHSLEDFLGALARSLRGIDGLYHNRGQQLPDPPAWKVFAEALVMASGYE